MATHIDTGMEGEELAAGYLVDKGYVILHRNWRHRRLEVDIIAVAGGILHFIEVKTRKSAKFGLPEENVDKKKIKHLIDASAEFLHIYPQWQRVQFDIISVSIMPNGTADYFMIEDIYL